MMGIFIKPGGEEKMIINTGGRTDTVQYYSDWLLNRFSEGYVLARNPLFCNKVIRYELTPDKVDCVVFCSKNYTPILPRLHEITDWFHTYFYYAARAWFAGIRFSPSYRHLPIHCPLLNGTTHLSLPGLRAFIAYPQDSFSQLTHLILESCLPAHFSMLSDPYIPFDGQQIYTQSPQQYDWLLHNGTCSVL